MMKKLQATATQIGLGIGACYAFFMVPSIQELFKPTFIILVRQVLALGFALCLMVNPKGLIEIGELVGPKLYQVLTIFFGKSNKNES